MAEHPIEISSSSPPRAPKRRVKTTISSSPDIDELPEIKIASPSDDENTDSGSETEAEPELTNTEGLEKGKDGRFRFLHNTQPRLTGNYWGTIPDAAEIRGTEPGRNFMIWRQMKKDVDGIAKPAAAPRAKSRPLDLIDCLPQRERRVYSKVYRKVLQKKFEGYIIAVATSADKLPVKDSYKEVFNAAGVTSFSLDAWRNLNDKDMQAVRIHLHRLCERIPVAPGDISFPSIEFLKGAATRAATSRAKSVMLPRIRIGKEKNRPWRIYTYVDCLSHERLAEGQMEKQHIHHTEISFPMVTMDQCHTIPAVQNNFQTFKEPELINAELCGIDHATQRRAIRLMQWLQSMAHLRVFGTSFHSDKKGSESSSDAIHVYKDALLKMVGMKMGTNNAPRIKYDTIFEGGDLYRVLRQDTHYTLHVSYDVRNRVKGQAFTVIEVPLQDGALVRVIEVIETVWLNTSNAEAAWEAGCIRADFEEQLWEDHESAAETCLASDRPRTVKLCRGCFTPTQVSVLQEAGGELLCPHCLPNTPHPEVVSSEASCHYCKEHKFSCDGLKPCGTCSLQGEACVYEQGKQDDDDDDDDDGEEEAQDAASEGKPPAKRTKAHRDKYKGFSKAQKEQFHQHKKWLIESSGYRLAFKSFEGAWRRDVEDRSYKSTEARERAIAQRLELLDGAWLVFRDKFSITKHGWYDVYLDRAMQFDAAEQDSRGPFSLSVDARHPVTVDDEGEACTHALENLVPTSYCFNEMKHIYDALIVALTAELCRGVPEERKREIQLRIDHLYLIRLQLPRERADRLAMARTDPRIESTLAQAAKGTADPAACLRIPEPWVIGFSQAGMNISKEGYIDRPGTRKLFSKPFPNREKVERIIDEMEERYLANRRYFRVQGTLYLFNPANAPKVWNWDENRRFYSNKVHNMTVACNKDYLTEAEPDMLLLVHCYQLANPPKGLEWTRTMLEPYKHHPTRASYGHAAHKMDMSCGLQPGYQTLDDFQVEEMNIDIEPWIWNLLRGEHDRHYDAIVRRLRTAPTHNPPYWTKETTGPPPPVPPTVWGGSGQLQKPSGKASVSKVGSKIVRKPSHGEEGGSASQRPKGIVQRGNLANSNNVCFASSIVQAFSNVDLLRQLVLDSAYFPFAIDTGRGQAATVDLKDPGLVNHKKLLERWRNAITTLQTNRGSVGSSEILSFMKALRKLTTEFPDGEEGDPALLCGYLLSVLNVAGDRSKPLTSITAHRPLVQLATDLDIRNKAGMKLDPLEDEAPKHHTAWRKSGNDSAVDNLCRVSVASESHCQFEHCPSPFSRGYAFEHMIPVAFPVGEIGYSEGTAYTVTQLLDLWHRPTARTVCDFDKDHGQRTPSVKKLLSLPSVLGIRVERQRLASLRPEDNRADYEESANFITNPLNLDAVIDLRPYVQQTLPSESKLGKIEPVSGITTYELAAIVEHRSSPRHYVAYAKAPDRDGKFFWACFDDLKGSAVWEDPFEKPWNPRHGEFVLFYVQKAPATAEEDAQKVGEESEHDKDSEEEKSCVCNKPESGFMIGCDGGCGGWFHGECVNITEEQERRIIRYICPNCAKKGAEVTEWSIDVGDGSNEQSGPGGQTGANEGRGYRDSGPGEAVTFGDLTGNRGGHSGTGRATPTAVNLNTFTAKEADYSKMSTEQKGEYLAGHWRALAKHTTVGASGRADLMLMSERSRQLGLESGQPGTSNIGTSTGASVSDTDLARRQEAVQRLSGSVDVLQRQEREAESRIRLLEDEENTLEDQNAEARENLEQIQNQVAAAQEELEEASNRITTASFPQQNLLAGLGNLSSDALAQLIQQATSTLAARSSGDMSSAPKKLDIVTGAEKPRTAAERKAVAASKRQALESKASGLKPLTKSKTTLGYTAPTTASKAKGTAPEQAASLKGKPGPGPQRPKTPPTRREEAPGTKEEPHAGQRRRAGHRETSQSPTAKSPKLDRKAGGTLDAGSNTRKITTSTETGARTGTGTGASRAGSLLQQIGGRDVGGSVRDRASAINRNLGTGGNRGGTATSERGTPYTGLGAYGFGGNNNTTGSERGARPTGGAGGGISAPRVFGARGEQARPPMPDFNPLGKQDERGRGRGTGEAGRAGSISPRKAGDWMRDLMGRNNQGGGPGWGRGK